MEEVNEYFKRTGEAPCKEAGMPYGVVATCPKAGQGGCLGRYGECDRVFVEMSMKFRKKPIEGIAPVSFSERFGFW